MQHILYIHGFNSSPLSEKAEISRLYFKEYHPNVTFHCPQIANHPKIAITQLEQIIQQASGEDTSQEWFFIGSSLGGYFSTYLAEKYNRPAVLINPAVKPYQLLADYLGEQTNPYTKETYHVTLDYIDDLKVLEQHQLEKNNYLLMVQTGDEVLDYRQSVNKYKNAQIIEQQGGDHSFVGYDKMLTHIATFFQFT